MDAERIKILKTLAGIAAVVSATALFYGVVSSYGLIKKGPAAPAKKVVVATTAPQKPIAAADSLSDGETLVPVTAPQEFLLADVSAKVDDESGAVTSIRILRSATCEGRADVPRRKAQNWSPGTEGGANVAAKWCIPVEPGSSAGYRDLNGDWQAKEESLSTDYAASYLRYIRPDGSFGAVKVAAVASCDDETGCGYVATISLDSDDLQITEWLTLGNSEMIKATLRTDNESVTPTEVAAGPEKADPSYRPIAPRGLGQ